MISTYWLFLIPVAFCLGWFLAERVIGANVDMWE